MAFGEVGKFVEELPFAGRLSEREKEDLIAGTKAVTYAKGEHIHSGSENCTGVIFVKKGCIRAYMLSEGGREITLYRLYEGDFCMLSASCILEAVTFDVFIDAEEDTDAFLIKTSAFRRLTENNLYVENFALHTTVERFSDVMWTMQQILFMSMDKRLAVFLYDEAAKKGSNVLKITHEQIARYIGSAREVVSRMLKYFANENIVSLSRNGITIEDKNKLLALTK